MKEKWKVKFGIILAGQAVSQIGSFAVQFAVIWWLAGKTSSPFILGVSGMAAYLPAVLLSPVAGVMADRYNRKIISIASDLSMGAAALLIALILQFIDMPVWVVLVLLFVRGVGGTFQQPAIQSIIPQLVPKDRLLKANGWIQLRGAGVRDRHGLPGLRRQGLQCVQTGGLDRDHARRHPPPQCPPGGRSGSR